MIIFFAVIALLVTLIMFIISFRAIYFAFLKKKDERSKWIVTKSMADSFIVLVILQTLLLVIKWVNYDFYQKWWPSF